MKKVTFIIPTLYGVRKPNYLDESVKSLIWHCELAKIDYTIFVAGRKNKNFDEWNNPKVFKEYIIPDDKHEEHEVAWYINKKIETKDIMVEININKNLNDIESVSLFFELTIKMLNIMNNANKKKLVEQDKNKNINKLFEQLNKLK